MKKLSKTHIAACDLYHILCWEGFACEFACNKKILTYTFPHETCEPIPSSARKQILRIVRDWLIDLYPYLSASLSGSLSESVSGSLSESVSGSLSESVSGSLSESCPLLAVREWWDFLQITINLKRAREASKQAFIGEIAREVCNRILQNRDVYEKELSIRDIEALTGQSYRQSRYIINLLEARDVCKRNGHLKTSGRDINYIKLKKFLRGD